MIKIFKNTILHKKCIQIPTTSSIYVNVIELSMYTRFFLIVKTTKFKQKQHPILVSVLIGIFCRRKLMDNAQALGSTCWHFTLPFLSSGDYALNWNRVLTILLRYFLGKFVNSYNVLSIHLMCCKPQHN